MKSLGRPRSHIHTPKALGIIIKIVNFSLPNVGFPITNVLHPFELYKFTQSGVLQFIPLKSLTSLWSQVHQKNRGSNSALLVGIDPNIICIFFFKSISFVMTQRRSKPHLSLYSKRISQCYNWNPLKSLSFIKARTSLSQGTWDPPFTASLHIITRKVNEAQTMWTYYKSLHTIFYMSKREPNTLPISSFINLLLQTNTQHNPFLADLTASLHFDNNCYR